MALSALYFNFYGAGSATNYAAFHWPLSSILVEISKENIFFFPLK